MATKVESPAPGAVRRGVHPGLEHGFDIRIDGAIAYRVRLIPSNRVLDSFPTAKEAMARVLAEISAGRSERTLVVDAGFADATWDRLSAGRVLRGLSQAAWGRHDPPPRKARIAQRRG